jgi:hypothetical protein
LRVVRVRLSQPGIIGDVVDIGGFWPFRGTVIWLTQEQGGRTTGPPATPPGQDYASTAFVPPHTVKTGLASFALRGFERGAWTSPAEGRWLFPESVAEDRPIAVGTTVVVTEGSRVVGHFHVEEALQESFPDMAERRRRCDGIWRVVPGPWRRTGAEPLPVSRDYEIELSRDVALVLFEWLTQREEQDWAGLPVTHPGELGALSYLAGVLERTLVETFDPRYDEMLAVARERLSAGES